MMVLQFRLLIGLVNYLPGKGAGLDVKDQRVDATIPA